MNVVSPNTFKTLVLGCVSLSMVMCAQPNTSHNPYQLRGIAQIQTHGPVQSVQDWAQGYTDNDLVVTNKEMVAVYANVPLAKLLANGPELAAAATLLTAGITFFAILSAREYQRLVTTHGEISGETFGTFIVIPAIYLGFVLLQLPTWKQSISNIRELWQLATKKTPLLRLGSQGIILANKTKLRWTEIGAVAKTQHQCIQPDGSMANTLHLTIFNPQGAVLTEIPGVLLPITIDALLELITYYQQKYKN